MIFREVRDGGGKNEARLVTRSLISGGVFIVIIWIDL
jgi:hypothetical protein